MTRLLRAALAIALLALPLGAALAQSSTTTVINGVSVSVRANGSQSVSATDDGARITVNGREVIFAGTSVAVDGIEVDLGEAISTLEIEDVGGSFSVSANGNQILSLTSEASGPDRGSELTTEGAALFNGDGVAQDIPRAITLFEEAARLGNGIAADNLAQIFALGLKGVPVDEARALPFAAQGAEAGRRASLFFHGRAIIEGKAEGDLGTGLAALEQSAEAGYNSALNYLGILFVDGDHVKGNRRRAAGYYRQAAANGYGASQNNLAWMLWEGNGIDRDPLEAQRLAGLAAEQGFTGSQFLSGVMLYFGDPLIEIDKPAAFQHFLTAAQNGHRQGAFNLGIMYRDGDGVERDLQKSLEWARVAAERGYEPAEATITEVEALIAEEAGPPEEPIYWYAQDGARVGPMTLSALREAFEANGLGASTLVWKRGLEGWIPARDMAELN